MPTETTYWEDLEWWLSIYELALIKAKIKSKYAEIINLLQDNKLMNSTDPEHQRYLSIAITEAQTAQIRAVKAVTAK